MNGTNGQRADDLTVPSTIYTPLDIQDGALPLLAYEQNALRNLSLFTEMAQPQQSSPWDLDITGLENELPRVTLNGKMEGGAYPPKYYAYEDMPQYYFDDAWHDALQAIEEFDWTSGENLYNESGATQSSSVESHPDEVTAQHDDPITIDLPETSDNGRKAHRYPSPTQSEPVTSTHCHDADTKTAQPSEHNADHDTVNDVTMGGMEEEVVPGTMNFPITPKSVRGMSVPAPPSMSPNSSSSRLSAQDNLKVQQPIINRDQTSEVEDHELDTSESWETDTSMPTPVVEDIKPATIAANHEQPTTTQHKSMAVQNDRPLVEQLKEAAITKLKESTSATSPDLSSLGYGQGVKQSEELESTGQANDAADRIYQGDATTPNPTAPGHEKASPSANLPDLPNQDLIGSKIDTVPGNLTSDDSDGIHLIGQPSKESSPKPTNPASRDIENARLEDLDDGAMEVEETSARSSAPALPVDAEHIKDTKPAQEQPAPDASATAPTGGDTRKRNKPMKRDDASDSENEAPEKKRAKTKEPESENEEFYDATDEFKDAEVSPVLLTRRQSSIESPTATDAKPVAIEGKKKEDASLPADLEPAYSENRQVPALSFANSLEEIIAPSSGVLDNPHTSADVPPTPLSDDYDMKKHFSDVPTRSPTHLGDPQTPRFQTPPFQPPPAFSTPTPHRSPRHVVSNRELLALSSTLAPGMHLGLPLQTDKKRKRKSASSIAGDRVYFEGDVEWKDDEGEGEEEGDVDTPVVKKGRSNKKVVDGEAKGKKKAMPRVDTRYSDGRMRVRPEVATGKKQTRSKAEVEFETSYSDAADDEKEDFEPPLFAPQPKNVSTPVALPATFTLPPPKHEANHSKRTTRGDTKEASSRASTVAKASDAEDVKPSGKKSRSSALATPATPTTVKKNKFGFTPPKTRRRTRLSMASAASTSEPSSATSKSATKCESRAKGTPKTKGSGDDAGEERMTRGAMAREEKEKNIRKRLRSGDV